jgi:hypothetical protein
MEWLSGVACQKPRTAGAPTGVACPCPSPPRDWGINLCLPQPGSPGLGACLRGGGPANEYRDGDVLIDENGLHLLQLGHRGPGSASCGVSLSQIIGSCQRASSARRESVHASPEARATTGMDVPTLPDARQEGPVRSEEAASRKAFLDEIRRSATALRKSLKGAGSPSACADTLSEASTQGPDSVDMAARENFMQSFSDAPWFSPELIPSGSIARKRRGSASLSMVGMKKLNRSFSPKTAAQQRSGVASSMGSLSLGPSAHEGAPPFYATFASSACHKKALGYGQVRKVRVIGKGNTSEVWHCRDTATGKSLAVKQMSLNPDAGRRSMVVRELATMYGVDHAAIVACHNVFFASSLFHLVMEMMDGGSLRDAINRASSVDGNAISPGALAAVARDVLCGLEFLHEELQVVHRDVKPSNILLTMSGVAKVGDLGICTLPGEVRADKAVKEWIGTMAYMSPERLRGDCYSCSADIWSLGLALIETVIGRLPLKELAAPATGAKTKLPSPAARNLEDRMQFWDLLDIATNGTCPSRLLASYGAKWAALQTLTAACLTKDASKRPSAQQLLRRDENPEPTAAGSRFLEMAQAAALSSWVCNGLAASDGCHAGPRPTDGRFASEDSGETRTQTDLASACLVETEGSEAEGWL